MKRVYSLCIACLLLAGCAQHYKMQTPFVESEYQKFQQKGESIVKGQVFLKTVGGEVRYGAGAGVILAPRTAYTTEMANSLMSIGPDGSIDNASMQLIKYCKTTKADAEGRFEIKDVPNGEYYIFSKVVWFVSNGYGPVATGSGIAIPVSVTKPDTYNVVVTR